MLRREPVTMEHLVARIKFYERHSDNPSFEKKIQETKELMLQCIMQNENNPCLKDLVLSNEMKI